MPQNLDRFRHDLAEVLPRWVSEGLVTPEQADGLRAYHQLDALPDQAGDRMGALLFAVGAAVIGLGLISFVAANWEAITPPLRVLGATLLMIAADLLGWRWLDTPGKARLGDVALVIGAFLFGADLALMAQWFQLSGDGGGLFLVWGLGALAMAWALRHVPTASVGVGALLGALASKALAPWLPWVLVVAVLPLGHLARSRWLLRLAAAALLWSVGWLSVESGRVPLTAALLAVGAGLMGAAALGATRPAWREARAALQDAPAGSPFTPTSPEHEVEASVTLGLWLLGMLLLGWSFQEAWRGPGLETFRHLPASWGVSAACLAAAGVLAALAGAARHVGIRRPLAVYGGLAGAWLGLTALAEAVSPAGQLAWPANALLLGLGLYAAHLGLKQGSRGRFWLGGLLISAQIGARFVEYDTGLLVKAAAFIAWGVALIALGRFFETRRKLARVEVSRG